MSIILPPNLNQVVAVNDTDLLVAWPTAGPGPLSGVAYSVIRVQLTATVRAFSIFGSGAGAAITSGAGNAALGPSALAAETTGSNNVAVGNGALILQNGGSQNVAVGHAAGKAVTTGGANTIVGDSAAPLLTSGASNIIIGQNAAPNLVNGTGNLYLGGGDVTGAVPATTSNSITVADGQGNVQLQYIGGWFTYGLTGAPTGGGKGQGSLNLNSGLYINGVPAGTLMQVGKLTGANFNSTADQAIALGVAGLGKFVVDCIVVTNASTSLTTAQGGIYASAAKTTPLFNTSATSPYSWLTTATRAANFGGGGVLGAAAANNTEMLTDTGTIFLSLTTAQGAPATADVYVFGRKLT